MFLDEVAIAIAGGKGGDGALSFHRAKYVPKGGPDGGNGGEGGHVILEADPNKNTLFHFRGVKRFGAENGKSGGSGNCTGRNGEDLVLLTPVGTQVLSADGKTVLFDLSRPGSRAVIARGGRGGKGNANFATSVRQTPRFAEKGEPGEELAVQLVLKLVADVGIIGMPSVGKSTLISVISSCKPKIADYPFTTLIPNLGVVSHRGDTCVVSDLPGLIEGASKGKGLGLRFLKHAERVRMLLHLVSADSTDPVSDYKVIRKELSSYSRTLLRIPEMVVLSRTDLLLPEEVFPIQKALKKAAKKDILLLSAPTHSGLTELLDATFAELSLIRESERADSMVDDMMPVFKPATLPRSTQFTVEKEGKYFRIRCARLEQIVIMSDLSNPEAFARIQDVIRKMGIHRELTRAGADEGDKLAIGDARIEYWGGK